MCNTIIKSLCVLLMLAACESNRPGTPAPPWNDVKGHVAAAATLTRSYAQSRLREWKVRASVSGTDCDILTIATAIPLDDAMVESIQYGAGPFDIHPGGVHRFYRQRAFRGVAYKDSAGRIWTYGAVTVIEAESLRPCR